MPLLGWSGGCVTGELEYRLSDPPGKPIRRCSPIGRARLLGDIRGKKILDIGCGLGESSTYFAMEGADVTASDVSPGMLELAKKVAARFSVNLSTHLASADENRLPDETFDVVYAANILHHSDIAQVLEEARRVLKPGGVFVSWDPADQQSRHQRVSQVGQRGPNGRRTPAFDERTGDF